MSYSISFSRITTNQTPTGGWKTGGIYFISNSGGVGQLKLCVDSSGTLEAYSPQLSSIINSSSTHNTAATSKAVYDGLASNAKDHIQIITNDDVTVTTDSTKGVSPYNTGYGYTNITINSISASDLKEGMNLLFCCGGSMVVASSYRNTRIRFGSTGDWIPVFNTTSICAGSSYLTNGRTHLLTYRTDIYSTGAFHIDPDSNSTYTPQSLGFGIGTCTTAAATVAKTATLSNYTLTTNGIVAVTFTYGVPARATLNINGKGAKPIYYSGSAITAGIINAGDAALFVYNGTNYILLSIHSTITSKENTSNKVTSISSSSTDTQYPSAKCVYDLIGDINSILDNINGEVI